MSQTPEVAQTQDRYLFVRRIAKGGMAEVWLTRERMANRERTIVLKLLLPELAEDPDFVRMFLDEARLASLLHHQNIVSIYDVGQLGDRYFIAMEYVAGRTLRQVLHQLRRDNRRLPVWFALSIGVKTCSALEHAHHACDEGGSPLHVVHRDVSPENIIVGYDGSVKVLDFGIAKASARGTRTRVGVMKGKHAYMAPEQILAAETGCSIDHRADLYSLGVVLYELLTTVRPFDADNELSLIRCIVEGMPHPEPPCTLAPWLEPEVEAVVLRSMARQPEVRFDSASKLRDALEECLRAIGQAPSDRHIAGMLSLILPPTGGSAVPAPSGMLAGPAGSGPGRGHKDDDESFAEPVTLAGWATEALDGNRSALGSQRPASVGASAAARPGRHCWDRVLERHQGARQGDGDLPDSLEDTTTRYTRPESGEFQLSVAERARIEFDRGVKLNRKKDFRGALEALERAVEYDPDNRLYQANLKLLRRKLEAAGS